MVNEKSIIVKSNVEPICSESVLWIFLPLTFVVVEGGKRVLEVVTGAGG